MSGEVYIRIAGTVGESIVDGKGIRFTLFTQGCSHKCPGCHNPHTHDPNGGALVSVSELVARIKADPLLDGVTLSGGEPFEQTEACAELARCVRELGLNVWTYTGYTFEELLQLPDARPLMEHTDILVDGPYIEAERTLSKAFIGSKNQRILDMPRSLASGIPTPAGL